MRHSITFPKGSEIITNKDAVKEVAFKAHEMLGQGYNIEFNLKGVEFITTECSSLLFGGLYNELKDDFFKRVTFKNANVGLQAVIRAGLYNRGGQTLDFHLPNETSDSYIDDTKSKQEVKMEKKIERNVCFEVMTL